MSERSLADPLRAYRDEFHVPLSGKNEMGVRSGGETDVIYLCGNSLGLLPRKTRGYLEEELKKWETR